MIQITENLRRGLQEKLSDLLYRCHVGDVANLKARQIICELADLIESIPADHLSGRLYDNHSILEYQIGNKAKSYDLSVRSIEDSSWNEAECRRLRSNQEFCLEAVRSRFEMYSPANVLTMQLILNRNRELEDSSQGITVTMTSCRRLSHFTSTVNSFLCCCLDLEMIHDWVVIDDNSSEEDRLQMQKMYPFIIWILKDQKSKGHVISMNMLRENVKTSYYFHLEDDWSFFRKDRYLEKCLAVIMESESYGQCLINREYGENRGANDTYSENYILTTRSKIRYYVHKYLEDPERSSYILEKGIKTHCIYWPHYSLRVGLNRTSVWNVVGSYSLDADHFEMEYASRYVKKRYVTTFLDNLSCIHTGRNTSERLDSQKINSYDLNQTPQFGFPKIDFNFKQSSVSQSVTRVGSSGHSYRVATFVLNLKRREDRLQHFLTQNHRHVAELQYTIIEAIDGQALEQSQKIQKLFQTNDYNYRRGVIGGALSNIQKWSQLLSDPTLDALIMFEDDIELAPKFYTRLQQVFDQLPNDDWDIVFLGHFLYPHLRREGDRSNEAPQIEQWNRTQCVERSMGGCMGYVISRRGALNMLQHLYQHGVYNAIDWIMFKTADLNKIYYVYPHLVYSECATRDNRVDSDIQRDNSDMFLTDEQWLIMDLRYWIHETRQIGVQFIKDVSKEIQLMFNKSAVSAVIYYGQGLPSSEMMTNNVTIIEISQTLNWQHFDATLNQLRAKYYKIGHRYIVIVGHKYLTLGVQRQITFSPGYVNHIQPY